MIARLCVGPPDTRRARQNKILCQIINKPSSFASTTKAEHRLLIVAL